VFSRTGNSTQRAPPPDSNSPETRRLSDSRDPHYGGSVALAQRVALHARKLTLPVARLSRLLGPRISRVGLRLLGGRACDE